MFGENIPVPKAMTATKAPPNTTAAGAPAYSAMAPAIRPPTEHELPGKAVDAHHSTAQLIRQINLQDRVDHRDVKLTGDTEGAGQNQREMIRLRKRKADEQDTEYDGAADGLPAFGAGVGKIGDCEDAAERSQTPRALQKAEALGAHSEYVPREHRHQN